MKLIFMIVESSDADVLSDELLGAGHQVTKLGSTGGFLRRHSNTLISGVEDDVVDDVLAIARRVTQSREELAPIRPLPFLGELDLAREPTTIRRGGAVIWVVPVDRFEKL